MNILPKKRWHVRSKDNIARVRKDEVKAAEEEKERQERTKLAEREAKRTLLLQKSRNNLANKEFISLKSERDHVESSSSHINFFKDVEEGVAELKQSNKEHDKEKKEEKEKYEKQIGYLTYLGQDTNEALGKKSWYDVAPNRSSTEKGEINMRSKLRDDPLKDIKRYISAGKAINKTIKISDKLSLYKPILDISTSSLNKKRKRRYSDSSSSEIRHNLKKSKHKKKKRRRKHKSKKYSSDSDSISEDSEKDEEPNEKEKKIELLRVERLKREKEERRKTEELLAKLQGKEEKKPELFKPKYHSQFNPELAKQNYNKNR